MAETLDAAPTTDLTYDSASWWERLDAKGDWANTDEDHSIAIDVLGNDVGALGIVKVNDTKITADMPPVTLASGATVDLDGRTLIYDPDDNSKTLTRAIKRKIRSPTPLSATARVPTRRTST